MHLAHPTISIAKIRDYWQSTHVKIITNLDAIQLSRLYPRSLTSTWRTHVTSLEAFTTLSVELLLTHFTEAASGVVLAVSTHAPSSQSA